MAVDSHQVHPQYQTHPFGSLEMKSCAFAARAAAYTCSCVAVGQPYTMLL